MLRFRLGLSKIKVPAPVPVGTRKEFVNVFERRVPPQIEPLKAIELNKLCRHASFELVAVEGEHLHRDYCLAFPFVTGHFEEAVGLPPRRGQRVQRHFELLVQF